MRKIDPPHFDDDTLLNNLIYSRSPHAVRVETRRQDILNRYKTYLRHEGNPWNVQEDPSFAPIKHNLEALYAAPPIVLDPINALRNSIEGACPMCGRSALGTLDHYLPQSTYTEFAFFSKNLIPACDRCNNNRGVLAKGHQPDERPVHPYFDLFTTDRILSVNITGDLRAPEFTPVAINLTGTQLATVQWHVDNVITPAGAPAFFDGMWGVLASEKRKLLHNRSSVQAVHESLLWLAEYEATQKRSLNAWESAFYHGVAANSQVVEYIFNI